MIDIIETQKKLVKAALPSGFEGRQAKILEELAKPFADEIYYDTLGNLICRKKGKGKKLMIPAHMDVIGFIATYIDDNGFIRFAPIGGHTPLRLIGTPVRFEGGMQGCIRYGGEEPAYKSSVAGIDMNDLYIDIGAENRAEAEKHVKVGHVAVFDTETCEIAGGNIMTPYADDLICCIIALKTMEALKNSPNDLYFVFTVREERGLLGAKTAAYGIQPDMCIALDLTRTGDDPPVTTAMAVKLGEGPAVKIKDSRGICNPQVVEHLRKAADKADATCQTEILLAGSTDAAMVQITRGGALSGTLSIPGRNIHSPGEIVNLKDIEDAVKVMVQAAMLKV